jgi:hypothetical protein
VSLPDYYPPATRKNDGSGTGTWSGMGKWKLVIHTTETEGVPDYQNGALAPHITYHCAKRQWVQHTPFNRPSESVMTFDDDQLIQVELVCYSAKNIADAKPATRLWVGNLTDEHLADLAAFTDWLRRYLPIQPRWPEKAATSYGQANAAGFRMTARELYAFDGILGHQHTPSPNTHWDPGAFPWARYIDLLQGGDMGHRYTSWDALTDEHQWEGPPPAWVDSNGVWAAYVAAGGTSNPDSYNLAFTRSDMAWVWNRFIRHNGGNRVGDLEKRVRALESSAAGGGLTLDAVVQEVIRRLANG